MEITKDVLRRHASEIGLHMDGYKQGYLSSLAWCMNTLDAKEEEKKEKLEIVKP